MTHHTYQTVVYYDSDNIQREYVQQMINMIGEGGLLHVYRSDAWIDAPPDCRTEVVDSDRSGRFRNELMSSLNNFFEIVRQKKVFNKFCSYRGVDLFETLRYEFFYSICKPAHLIWVLNHLAQKYTTQKIVLAYQNSDDVFSTLIVNNIYEHPQDVVSSVQIIKIIGKGLGNGVFVDTFWRFAAREIKQSVIRCTRSRRTKNTNDLADSGEKKKVLFVENFPNSSKISAAVANKLEKRSNVEVKIVATRNSVTEAISDVFPPTLLDNTASIRTWVGIVIRQFMMVFLILFMRSRKQLINREKNWIFQLVISSNLINHLSKSLLRAIYYVGLFSAFSGRWRPNLVATTSVNGIFARAAVLQAKQAKVPTCFLQHGIILGEPYELYVLQDYAVVWGEYFKQIYMRSSDIEPANILTGGSPKFDKFSDQEFAMGNVASPNQKLHIVYFPSLVGGSTVSIGMSKKMLEMVVGAVQAIEHVRLTIKIKPDDKNPILANVAGNKNVSLSTSSDILGVLSEADIVIVSTSTVGMEACVLQKPLIILALDGVQVPDVYKDYKAAVYVNNNEELIMGLTTIMVDLNFKRNLMISQKRLTRDLFGNPVGGATGRIADIIYSIVG